MKSILSSLLAFALLCSLTQAQVPVTGAGRGAKGGGGGGGYTGPGDVISGAFAWWGFRAYNNTVAAAHQNVADLCDTSCVHTATIPANTNGTITVTATTCGGNPCTLVKKLYDQTGNGHDISQGTTANMPTYNGTGMPSMTLSGGFGGLVLNTAVNITLSSTAFSISTVASPLTISVSGSMNFVSNGNSGNGVGFDDTASGTFIKGSISSGFDSSNTATGGAYSSLQFLLAASSNTNGSKINLEGTTTNGTNSGALGWASDPLYIMDQSANSVGFVEAGIWNSDVSGSFASLLTNQQAYCTSIGGSC